MKAQRRHELKTNTLAEAMVHLPNSGLRSAATSVTIVLAGVLIGLLIRYRISTGEDRAKAATDNLAVVREEIEEMKALEARGADPSQPDELYKDIDSRLSSVLADAGSGNPQLAAEAMIARGDTDWNYASFLSSTTQPSMSAQTPSDLLSAAEAAYQQVLSTYPDQEFSVTTARFSLAAIGENRHDWGAARRQYQSIVDDAGAGEIMHDLAARNLAAVDQLEHPPVIAAATQAALARLGAAGAEFYIHCGDVGGQETLDLLAGLPLAFVWGNCDFQTPQLRQYAESLGMKCHGDFADLELDGRRIAVTHGDNPAILQRITSEKRHQYLLHGHTHVARDQVIDGLRWINPGAVHRSPRPSVAVLDTQSDSLRFIPLKDLKGA